MLFSGCKRRICVLVCTLLIVSLVGCSAEQPTEAPVSDVVKVEFNDYNGAIIRSSALEDDIKGVVNEFRTLMEEVKKKNPDSYWNSEDFSYLEFDGLERGAVSNTEYLNERLAWNEVKNKVQGSFMGTDGKMTVQSFSLSRDDVNEYTLSYKKNGKARNKHCIYDASHDWLSTVSSFKSGKLWYYYQLFEYGRLADGRYALQTQNQRVYAVYKDGNLESFWYSKLSDENREKYPAEKEVIKPQKVNGETILVKTTEAIEYADNVYTSLYDEEDSLFKRATEISPLWVVEEPTVDEILAYENGVLTSRKYNKLSGMMEECKVAKDGTVTKAEYEVIGRTVLKSERGVVYLIRK